VRHIYAESADNRPRRSLMLHRDNVAVGRETIRAAAGSRQFTAGSRPRRRRATCEAQNVGRCAQRVARLCVKCDCLPGPVRRCHELADGRIPSGPQKKTCTSHRFVSTRQVRDRAIGELSKSQEGRRRATDN